MSYYKFLDKINFPSDLKKISESDLQKVSDELRRETINTVSKTGGHLGASLGVVELTVAIHHVFNTPKDKLVWDVSHQCYPHKIITGRKKEIRTLRKGGGLSGFTKREESEYDPFGAAHSSTSISSTLGMSVAKKLSNDNNNVIAVIGDGAMSAGMAYEALNNVGSENKRMFVILNDNEMSIAPPVGAMPFPSRPGEVPTDVVIGSRDDFADPGALDAWSGVNLHRIEGADHFFGGHHEDLARTLKNTIAT